MKPHHIKIVLLFLFTCNLSLLHAQLEGRQATLKYNKIIGGQVNITRVSQNTLFSPTYTALAIAPQYFSFVSDGFALGGGINISHIDNSVSRNTIIKVGPRAGYYYEFSNGNLTYAKIGGDFNYQNLGTFDQSGFGAFGGVGYVVRNGHLGISLEAGLSLENFSANENGSALNTNSIYFSVGLEGFLYPDSDNQ